MEQKNLSVVEYYNILQREYLIAEFRSKIYISPNDKRYYKRVMQYKRNKIDDIAKRNNLDSIFTNAILNQECRDSLFEYGKPLFEMNAKDEECYFSVGNYFSYMGEPWKLEEINGDVLVIFSEKKKIKKKISKKDAVRIL
jgi:hypothetical protein